MAPTNAVEVDMALPLVNEINIYFKEFSIKQKVPYKNLPNACFHFGNKDWFIKNFPLKQGRQEELKTKVSNQAALAPKCSTQDNHKTPKKERM